MIEASRYVSEFAGGHGCVRDIIEQVLRARDDWARDSRGMHSSEYRPRSQVKPKSNERGCLKLLDSPFFIFRNSRN